MKKLIYVFLLATLLTASFSACTEDEVKPASSNNGGGNPIKE